MYNTTSEEKEENLYKERIKIYKYIIDNKIEDFSTAPSEE